MIAQVARGIAWIDCECLRGADQVLGAIGRGEGKGWGGDMMKIGVVICDRYADCAGGKCFRAARERAGAFARYDRDEPLEVVGFVSCGGCPGGTIEHAPAEMIANGAEAIHLATGLVVGYPPCPWIDYFKDFIERRFDVPVVIGTHPIPEAYRSCHAGLASWPTLARHEALLASDEVRAAYG
jgi:predicted metal-binding protein